MRRQSSLFVLGLLVFSYGGCCVYNSSVVREMAADVPRMTCDQLTQNGPEANDHVTIPDVRICSRGYLFTRDTDVGALDQLCIPVYSARLANEPDPRDLRLVLRILDDREVQKLIGQPEPGEFTFGVRWGPDQIEPAIVKGLEEKYPGIQFANCYVLTASRLEPTAARAESIRWSGIVAFLVGGAMILGWFAWRVWFPSCGRATSTHETSAVEASPS